MTMIPLLVPAALLYIVPFTLGSVVVTAVLRGEVSQVLKFTEREGPTLGGAAPAKDPNA